MIAPGTVLVLGAGASAPYGYPLGRRLVTQILERLRPDSIKPGTYRRALLDRGLIHDEIDDFQRRLSVWDGDSIDEFLANQDSALVKIGKMAIADRILAADRAPQEPDPPEDPRRWYPLLFRHLAEPSDATLSIITFNYDQSLDRYLNTAIEASFSPQEQARAAAIRARFEIIHVHGEAAGSTIAIAAQSIVTIHDADEASERFAQAQARLRDARRVAFIGFGYHPVNLRRIGITDHVWSRGSPDLVCGTQFDLLRNEVRLAEQQLERAYGDMSEFYDHHALRFLRTVALFD